MNVILEIQDKERFDEAMAFSRKHIDSCHQDGMCTSMGLDRAIERLKAMAKDGGIVKLYNDFVEHSFLFEVVGNDGFRMNGGLILHGYEPTLSVEVVDDPHMHYSIHT